MGNCLFSNCAGCDMVIAAPFYGNKGYQGNLKSDLSGRTFSHYSLTSDTSFLDLYPTLKYMEQDQSSSSGMSGSWRGELSDWRHSSLPLIDDDESILETTCNHVGVDENRICSVCYSHTHGTVKIVQEYNNAFANKCIEGNEPHNVSDKHSNIEFLMLTDILHKDNNISKERTCSQAYGSNTRNNFDVPQADSFRVKDELVMEVCAPLSIEEELDDISNGTSLLNKEWCVDYTNLNGEENSSAAKTNLNTRNKFNWKTNIFHSVTSIHQIRERNGIPIFFRRNKVQNESRDKKIDCRRS